MRGSDSAPRMTSRPITSRKDRRIQGGGKEGTRRQQVRWNRNSFDELEMSVKGDVSVGLSFKARVPWKMGRWTVVVLGRQNKRPERGSQGKTRE